ncbi:unnamed protein product, partial [marine sediment metagenome]
PLCSLDAHGRVGGLIFEGGPYGQYVKTHVPQRGRPTAAQLYQNYLFGVAADKWRTLTDEKKELWNKDAAGMQMTGFNLYIKRNIHHPEWPA